jgi:hypothetical protein
MIRIPSGFWQVFDYGVNHTNTKIAQQRSFQHVDIHRWTQTLYPYTLEVKFYP